MSYDVYQQARDVAWKFLINNHVTSLPVKLSAICKQRNISLLYDYDRKYLPENKRGCTFIDCMDKFSVVLNPYDDVAIQRYTTAHELGHIVLDHFSNQTINSLDMEYQADRFAIDILAPACVLWKLDLHTAKDISELCNISMKSAQIRAERMKILYSRNKFLISPLERQVCEQFSDFIHQCESR